MSLLGLECKPIEAQRTERHLIGLVAHRREFRAAEDLDRRHALHFREIQLHVLWKARQIRDHQHDLVLIAAKKRQHLAIRRPQKFERSPAQSFELLALLDQVLGPPQQRVRIVLLAFHIDGFVMIRRVDGDGHVKLLRIGARETGIAIGAPLHGRAHAVAIAQIDVVAHADFVAVINDGRAGQRKQQGVHQLNLAAVVFQQRRQTPANPEIDAHPAVVRIDAVHVVALFVGHHFERQLIVIAQEQRPLAIGWNGRRLLQDLHHRKAILHANGHEQPRHQREVKRHVAFRAVGKIGDRVLGPLVGFGQQNAVLVFRIDVLAKLFQERVSFGKILAVGAFALVEIRHRVQAESVHAQIEPKVDHLQDRLRGRADCRS